MSAMSSSREPANCGLTAAAPRPTPYGSAPCGRHAAELMVDVSKRFEHAAYPLLIGRAAQLGYPLRLLRLSLRTYRWPGRVADGISYAAPCTPAPAV